MCYSVESSLKTTAISFVAILYLLQSDDPYFKWIGIALIGWCGMQFAELLLWLTDPRKGCTDWNKIITMTLIPFILVLQPLGSLVGSFYVIPWNRSSEFRKTFTILFPILIITAVGIQHYYDPHKVCTTVTPNGHLYWSTDDGSDTLITSITYFIWGLLIITPILLFWNKYYILMALLCIIPLFGFLHGYLYSDAKPSIWCYYTSYTSGIAILARFLQQAGLYDIMRLL